MMLDPQQRPAADFEPQLRNYFNGRDDADDMVQQPNYYLPRGEHDNNVDQRGMIDLAARQLKLRNMLEQRNVNADSKEMADSVYPATEGRQLPKWMPESAVHGQRVRVAASKGHKEQMPELLGNGRY